VVLFWAVGARLFIAGVRQVAQRSRNSRPRAFSRSRTARHSRLCASSALPTCRQVGLASLAVPARVVPAAIVGGLFYGLAAAGHTFRGKRNFKEQTALISDIFAFVILAVFVVSRGF
jgi:hypothetical protein